MRILGQEINNDITTFNQAIAEKIKLLCEEQGMTYPKLAKDTKISPSNLYTIIRGETTPSTYILASICEGLGISLSQFFASEEEKKEYARSELSDRIEELSEKNQNILAEIAEVLLRNQ